MLFGLINFILTLVTNIVHMQERRTRISGKLKKLQELVPNMDKVITSYSCETLYVTGNIYWSFRM